MPRGLVKVKSLLTIRLNLSGREDVSFLYRILDLKRDGKVSCLLLNNNKRNNEQLSCANCKDGKYDRLARA